MNVANSEQPKRRRLVPRKRLSDQFPGTRIEPSSPYMEPGSRFYFDSELPLPDVFFRKPSRKRPKFRKATDSRPGNGHIAEYEGMPWYLDRRNWTKEDYRRHEAIWSHVIREEQRKRREVRSTDREIFDRVREHKEQKTVRRAKREANKLKRLERKARRLKRERERSEWYDQILACVGNGRDTVGKIRKVAEIETAFIRQTLRRLIADGKVVKPSPRRYVLATRRRLAPAPVEARTGATAKKGPARKRSPQKPVSGARKRLRRRSTKT